MKVWVGHYQHRHGSDIAVYSTEERAENARQQIADEWWERELGDVKKPASRYAMAEAYFEYIEDESFDIIECEIDGAIPSPSTPTEKESPQ